MVSRFGDFIPLFINRALQTLVVTEQTVLLCQIAYENYNWHIRGNLKVTALLRGSNLGT
jgi:hypothetical protein